MVSRVQIESSAELPGDQDPLLFLRTEKGGKVAAIVAGHPATGVFVLSPATFSFDPDDLVCELIRLDRSRPLVCPSGLTLVTAQPPYPSPSVASGAALIELDASSLASSVTDFVPNLDYLRVDE